MHINLSFRFALILICCFFCTLSLFPQDGCTADVIIKSDIKNITVFVNGRQISNCDSLKLKLPEGQYVISVTENSDRWNVRTYIDTIQITNCEEIILEYHFRDEVYLDSEPQDAEVFVSDSLVGYTPLFLNREINSVILKKPGYQEVSFHPGSSGSEKIKLEYIGLPVSESFFDEPVFKILVGSLVVLGGITAYYKLKADEKYDEYKITGNQKLLDETNKYDWISGISFGLVQINFGILIYHFLAE